MPRDAGPITLVKFNNKKLQKLLNYTGKAVILFTLVGITFSPLGQIFPVQKAEARVQQTTRAACISLGGTASNDTGGQLVTCTIPDSVDPTKAAQTDSGSRSVSTAAASGDFGCSASGFVSSEGFAICVASLVYYIGPGLARNVAYVAAYFFSYTISLSLNSVAYALDFLSSGWTTVRDLANMAFILILVYIAFMIMFQAETTGTIRMLAWVIFIALIINFSFFLTRVVIDAGNILSVQFYNAIPQTATLPGTAKLDAFGGSGVKDLSASVMDALKLQTLFSKESFAEAQKAANNSVMGGLTILTVVYLAVAVMFWILFFVFLQVGIKFLFRIVVLWFIIIAAPLALIAKAVPQNSVKKYYDTWQSYLIKFSFYPAIFLFIYLIMVKFIQQMLGGQGGNLVSNIFSGQTVQSVAAVGGDPNTAASFSVAGAIANVAIRMGFIVAMFYIALKASDWIVQEGSNAASNITGRLTGAALGTAAFAGRVGLGGVVGGTLARQPTLANSKYAAARGLWNVGRFLNNRTYDARNVPGIKRGLGVLGGDLIKGRTLDVGKGAEQTARDLENKIGSYSDKLRSGRAPSEAGEKDRKELNNRVAEIKKREEIKQLAKVEQGWSDKEKELKSLQNQKKNAIGLSPTSQDRLTQLEKANKDRDALIKSARSYNPDKLAAISPKDLKAVMQHLTDAQRKAIEVNVKIAPEAKQELKKQWHETASEAPLIKSQKELEELGKIHEELSRIGVSLNKMETLGKYSKPASTVEITEAVARSIKKEVESLKTENEGAKREADERRKEERARGTKLEDDLKVLDKVVTNIGTTAEELRKAKDEIAAKQESLNDSKIKMLTADTESKNLNQVLKKIEEAIKRSETLASTTKEVPGGVGNHKDEGAFTHSS